MAQPRQILQDNVRLLRSRASGAAVAGTLIAIVTVVVATLLSAFLQDGYKVTLSGILAAQSNNPVLWLMDAMPFIFAFWGQYTSSVLAMEAGAMVFDQTQDLRTQAVALESRISHESTHDPLTGLPNRVLYIDRIEQALQLSQDDTSLFGLLYLDLDGFKEINSSLGHHSGDRVLKSLASRILNAVPETVTVARFGGDDFGVAIPNLTNERALMEWVRTIRKAIEAPYVLEGIDLNLTASIGAALFPTHGRDADTLLQRAELALYAAKSKHIPFALYAAEQDQSRPYRLILQSEVHQAIQRRELFLEYQPVVSAATGRVQGVEALLRWEHHRYGLVKPDEFIALAERSGFINRINEWVLRHALEDASKWARDGLHLQMAVNVTAANLLDPEFVNIVAGLLASTSLEQNTLTLEITESTLLTDRERARGVLQRLAALSVQTVIDDFGTGYSSLAYLRSLPVRGLKIDRSFIADMATGPNGEILVNAIIQLAHALKLHVCAEGVEADTIMDRLRKLGCDTFQGFGISPSLPAAVIPDWCADYAKRLKREPGAVADAPFNATVGKPSPT